MRQIVVLSVLLLVIGIATARWIDRSVGRTPHDAKNMTAMRETPLPPVASHSVVLNRGRGGHFWTDAKIDGRRVEFVVDTGASAIALRESDAARLGFRPTPRDYSVKVSTANGMSRAAPMQLRTVAIGDIVVRDVLALVHPDNELGVNLLGMSFLSKIRWTHDRGKLVLDR
jgi:aspartyl protease family protein